MKGRRLESEKAGEYNRTTSMLVAVVLCFVVTELPQGVLAFLSGIDNSIFQSVYAPLGDVWDILVIINSSVNFLLYCIMSKLFRGTFCDLFVAPLCMRCACAAADDNDAHQERRMQPMTGVGATAVTNIQRSAPSDV